MDFTEKQIKRFWKKISISEIKFYNNSPCWEWTGSRCSDGYGSVKINNKSFGTHRISWILCNGEIENGLFVLHHCDNPCCVNPTHLFLGTQRDNSLDKVNKGRGNYLKGIDSWPHNHKERLARGEKNGMHTHPEKRMLGEKNKNSKLKESEVIEIRQLFETGSYSKMKLGKIFNISDSQIYNIVNYISWNYLK